MNSSLGMKLFGFKFLFLAFIFLALMPPFSFANLGIGIVGLFFCGKSMEAVIKKNGNFNLWAVCCGVSFMVLGLITYANH